MALSNNTKTMKKFFAAAAILFVTLSTQAQEVFVKVQYKENTTYKQVTKTVTDLKMTYGGSQEILDALKAQGVENPMVQKQETDVTTTTKTAKAGKDKVIPFTMALDMGGEQGAMLGKVNFYGNIKPGQGPAIDSIYAPQMEANVKDMMKKMLDGMLKQAVFPETKVKVGGTFKQEVPMELPMGPITFNLKSTTTYKLTKVEGNNAYFDTDIIITMDGTIEGQDVKASGAGKGKSVYDIKNNFMVKTDAAADMNMAMEMQGVKMDIATKTDTKQTVEITAVK